MINYNIESSFIRKRGNNYNVYIEYINEDGKRKQKSLAKYENKKDAEKHLIDLKSSINNNKFIISKDITFVDRFKVYLYDKNRNFSPLTIKNYEDVLKNSIETFFKDTLLQDITPYMLQQYINTMYAKYARSTADIRVVLVTQVLNEAFRLREINENPCNYVKSPSFKNEGDKVKEPFNREEAKVFMEKLEGKPYEVPLLLMLTMGLRAEEACGLKWKDVDFENNTISVNQVLIKAKGVLYVKPPKTSTSIRTISAPPELMAKLKKLKKKYNEYKIAGALDLEGDFEDLVCLNINLQPIYTARLWENFSDFCKAKNIRKIRLHDLRHTHATMLVLSGVDFKTISHRLGHKDIKITLNRYSHVLKEMDNKASESISSVLFK